ncbi:MAG: YciI family protein [Alphaproteobacteria bacterium]|nr:YciI family protein [Alphaproteobacteria bacterium]
MLFVIFCIDRPGAADARRDNIQAHVDYVAAAEVTVVMSGPLVTDDGAAPLGSLLVVDAADRAAADHFHRNDPLYKAGIWATTELRAFDKRVG